MPLDELKRLGGIRLVGRDPVAARSDNGLSEGLASVGGTRADACGRAKELGGGLAQLGEHYVRNVGVGGSTPLPSTIPRSRSRRLFGRRPLH